MNCITTAKCNLEQTLLHIFDSLIPFHKVYIIKIILCNQNFNKIFDKKAAILWVLQLRSCCLAFQWIFVLWYESVENLVIILCKPEKWNQGPRVGGLKTPREIPEISLADCGWHLCVFSPGTETL